MTFWTIAVLMAAAAAAIMVLPLLRGQRANQDAAAYDLEVYRDQMAELTRDRERGTITEAELEAAHAEIARRILAADTRLQEHKAQAGAGQGSGLKVLAAVLGVAVLVGAVPVYLWLGNPGAPDMPLAQRTDLAPAGSEEQRIMRQIANLARAAEADPANAEAWLRLAEAYRLMEMFGDAVPAYRKALALGPLTPDIRGDFAESLVMAGQGSVTPEAKAIFQELLSAASDDPRSRFYLALGDYQAGRTREALDGWAALIAASPADAPWLGIVRQNLAQAANDLGLDVAEVTPDPLPARSGGMPQISPEQRAEVESMSPEDRQQMIRQMVEGLDARLRDNPTDLEGWERLIRARVVLGERDAAQAALKRALEAFSNAPVPQRRLVDLAAELQLETPEESVQAPDIGAMVERLAARLKDNPDDLQGWMMLVRSYTVLGEQEKAQEALDNAARLAPDDPQVLTLQARAIRDANGGKDNERSIAILRRVLEIAPDTQEALWFLGNAEAEAGNRDQARALLERLLAQLPEDNPDRSFVVQRLQELGG